MNAATAKSPLFHMAAGIVNAQAALVREIAPLSPAQRRTVEDAAIAPPPAHLVLSGRCTKFSDGTFTWTLELDDEHGRVIKVTGARNTHASIVLRELARCTEVAPDQFSHLIGRA